MRYLVSARKYRPQVFGDLVGQEHVAETLSNALRLDRLAHAYLFSGPRGVGKTTAARILAKAINCEVPLDARPGAEPCRACDSCRAFEEGRSLNIIEIDAASNNKVDDIRELRETVRVPPQGARRKVYIVDEVHMLSTSAFNALLKTLEEPPPYVLFIFATTEPHKVLPTILSRCQRFDFRRIAVDETVAHLRSIAVEEGVDADEASLMLIARKGDGALRDALSAFDQAVALEGTTLRYGALAAALGVVDVDLYFEASEHVRTRSAAGMLGLVDGLVRRGYDLTEFVAGLQEHLRNLIVARTMPDPSLIEASSELQNRYADEAARWTEADLLRQLALVADAEPSMRGSSQPRLRLELALLRLTALASAHDLNAALRAVERLDAHAATGAPLPAARPSSARPTSAAPSAPQSGGARVAEPPAHFGARPSAQAPPASATPASAPPTSVPSAPAPSSPASALGPASPDGATAARSEAGPAPASSASQSPPASEIAPTSPVRPPLASEPPAAEAAPAAPPRPSPFDDDGGTPVEPVATPRPPRPASGLPLSDASSRASTAGVAPTATDIFKPPALRKRTPENRTGDGAVGAASDVTASPAAPTLDALPTTDEPTVRRAWAALAESVTSVRLAAYVRHARPVALRGATLVLAVPDRLAADGLRGASGPLLALLAERLGSGTAVTALDTEVDAPAPVSSGTVDPEDPFAVLTVLRQGSPAANRLIDRFGAELAF